MILPEQDFKNAKELADAVRGALIATRGEIENLKGNVSAQTAVINQVAPWIDRAANRGEEISARDLIKSRMEGNHAHGSTNADAVRAYVAEEPPRTDAQFGDVKFGGGILALPNASAVALWGDVTPDGGLRHGLIDDPQPISRDQANLQNEVTKAMFLVAFGRAAEAKRTNRPFVVSDSFSYGVPVTRISAEDVKRYLPKRSRARLGAALAAMGPEFRAFAPNSGEGAEIVLTNQTIPSLIRFRDLEDRLVQLFTRRQLPFRSVVEPRLKSRPQPYRFGDLPSGATEATNLRATQVGFDTVSTEVKPLGLRFLLDWYANEDALLDVLVLLQSEGAIAMTRALKDLLINGDTASSLDSPTFTGSGAYGFSRSGVPADQWHLSTFDGLRKMGNANKIDLGSDTGASGFRKLLASLGDEYMNATFIVSRRDLIVSVVADTKLESAETFGQAAVLLAGIPGKIYDQSILPTDAVPTNLASTGVHTGSGTTTVRLAVDPSDYEIQEKGPIVQAIVNNPLNMSVSMVMASRVGFMKKQPAVDAATNPAKSVAVGRNLPTSI